MANPPLDLNAATPHEEEPNPTKTLDPSDSPAAKSDPEKQPKSPSSADENGSKNEGEVKKTSLAKVGSPDSGAVNDIQKKMKRAERFGMPVQLTEEEKRNSRAERFGTGTTVRSTDASKQMEEQKRKARAERFGLAVPTAPPEEEAKKKARLERFGSGSKLDPAEEEKRKARAIRFANAPATSASPVIDKGSNEPKTAIAGNAGGSA